MGPIMPCGLESRLYAMHHFGRFDERALAPHPVFDGHSRGYTSAPLINRQTGSVHTGLSVDQLAPGGAIDPHVHSFEEGAKLLGEGKKINYEGASGSCDFDAVGDIVSRPFSVQQVRQGKIEQAAIIQP